MCVCGRNTSNCHVSGASDIRQVVMADRKRNIYSKEREKSRYIHKEIKRKKYNQEKWKKYGLDREKVALL